MRYRNLLVVLAPILACTPNCGAVDPPNVVLILVDDMGWSDLGCYGGEIPTPNLDTLATSGLRFTQFYNCARCSPSRASLLTGQYPHQVGMGHLDGTVREGHPGFQGRLSNSCVTIAETLHQAGYFTAMVGKWHLGQQHGTSPRQRGFERSLNLMAGGFHFHNQTNRRNTDPHLYLNGEPHALNDPLFGAWYGTELWTSWGLKFIDESQQSKKPFFLYLSHCNPHFPLMAPEPLIAKHRGSYLAGWDRLRERRFQRQLEMKLLAPGCQLSPREQDAPAWDSLDSATQTRFDDMMAIYAAMVEAVDISLGQLVEGLKSRQVWDNTVVLFMSDNGGNGETGPAGRYEGDHPGDAESFVFLSRNWATLNNTPFRKWKRYAHEGGIATPLIAHWPRGIQPTVRGSIVHDPAHVMDVLPTVLDLAHADYPSHWQGHAIEPPEGVSLAPAFAGQAVSRASPIFFNHEDNRAVRLGQWKLVAVRDGPWELYDLTHDRSETENVAQQFPKRVSSMVQQYDEWSVRTRVLSSPQKQSSPTGISP